ncbi:MAG TPA: selenocysteine-specific translation elongation factor [Bryobacteraceae bacterium]
MRNLIVGTAGHIDHGKTSLVRALTGVDTDRLEEEKRRGISIDLGFASLDLGDGVRIGLVDVPGHERFIKNMLAGASGIDLVLFIIAADESIKPQTREHFEICRLLGIPRGIVVLTKSDLVDADLLGLVRLEAEEFVEGSFLEGAPIVAVSSTTGAGLDELKRSLKRMASDTAQKDSQLRPRLPIDRAFSMKGFGTVVTGTLMAGSIAIEAEMDVQPLRRRVRVRGLQVHGAAVKKAVAGQRTAINLAGIEPSELARGMVLTEPGLFEAVTSFDASLELLKSAKPLKHGTPVHLHMGAAEIEAEVRLFEPQAVRPGTRTLIRFHLKEPLLALPGDRFIIRMFSPVVTIGGGKVVDISTPPKRMNRPLAGKRAARFDSGTPAERLLEYVRESPFGLGFNDIVRLTGWTDAVVEKLSAQEELIRIEQPQWWLASRAWATAKIAAIRETLRQFHRASPLLAGMAKEEIRSKFFEGAPAFLLDALLKQTRDIVADADLLRLAAHKVTFKEDEDAALAKIEGAFEQAGLAVPSTGEVLAGCGVEATRAKSLLQILIKRQRLVRIGDDLVFHASAIEALMNILGSKKGHRFSVPEFKEWTHVSRKYAIPLLEFLDRERRTRREGDSRVVL